MNLLIMLFAVAFVGLFCAQVGASKRDLLGDMKTEKSGLHQEVAPRKRPSRRSAARSRYLWGAGATAGAVILVAAFILWTGRPGLVLSFCVWLLCAFAIVNNLRRRRSLERRNSKLHFFLPLVIERIIMGVQAGLDIVPALKAVIDSEEECGGEENPVTELLQNVYARIGSGHSLEAALMEVGTTSEVSSVRHAFAHLALASREGGELSAPLRELGDSTQLFYQDAVEHKLAKLPAKATLPLVCMFAGLIICSATMPMLHVLEALEAAPVVNDQ